MSFTKKIYELLNNSPRDFIYWTRLILAIIAGFLCAILRLDTAGLVIGMAFYLISYTMFRYIIKIDLDKVDGEAKLYTIGFGTYLAMWITVWALLHTYLVA